MKEQLEYLEWDSTFLGYAVGRLLPTSTDEGTLRALLAEASRLHYRLLYWSAAPDDAQAAASARAVGAHLADNKITYLMAVPAPPPMLPPNVVATDKVTPELLELALQAGHQSRFQTDTNFEATVYQRLYTSWIKNSVSRKLAKEVLVFRPTAAVAEAGMITLAIKNNRVDIGLLAVDKKVRGQAIGSKLVAAAQYLAAEWGYYSLQVVTQQTNIGACRFYERCGFVPFQREAIYHIWLPEDESQTRNFVAGKLPNPRQKPAF